MSSVIRGNDNFDSQYIKRGLLAEYTVSGSAVTSIDFSGLDINTHKSYRVEIDLVCAGSGSVYLFINNDTTITNYYSQLISSNDTTIGGGRGNSSRIVDLITGDYHKCNLNVSLIYSKVVYNSFVNYSDDSNIQTYLFSGSKIATVANITQLTFTSSVASSIGVGSKIRIYRGDV